MLASSTSNTTPGGPGLSPPSRVVTRRRRASSRNPPVPVPTYGWRPASHTRSSPMESKVAAGGAAPRFLRLRRHSIFSLASAAGAVARFTRARSRRFVRARSLQERGKEGE
eukprot:scaffold312302_cov32-Tisochrysis_lutea.AAC.4